MRARLLTASFLVCALASLVPYAAANAPEGIPRALARERALEVSYLRYHLTFILAPQSDSVTGTEDISFVLRNEVSSLLLDFRDGTITSLSVNGTPAPILAQNGHVDLPASQLRPGNNIVSVRFTAKVGP